MINRTEITNNMKKVLFRFLLCLVFVIVIYGKMEVKADDSIVLKVGEKNNYRGKVILARRIKILQLSVKRE